MSVAPLKYKYARLTGAGTTTVVSGPCLLHSVIVGTAGTTITIFDNTAGSGTTVGVIGAVTGGFIYDIGLGTGLTITTVGTPDATVCYAII